MSKDRGLRRFLKKIKHALKYLFDKIFKNFSRGGIFFNVNDNDAKDSC